MFSIFLGAFVIFVSYMIGSLSSAVIVARFWGLPDPRTSGSQNPGATNMLRLGGTLPAILTLAGDALKGFLPIYICKLLLPADFSYLAWVLSAVFLAAVMGHLYPLFFEFKGGKGVATALGGLFGLAAWLGWSFVGIWLTVALLTRYSSLSALVAITLVPIIAYFGGASYYTFTLIIVAALLFWRHKSNVEALLAGKEGKIGEKDQKINLGKQQD